VLRRALALGGLAALTLAGCSPPAGPEAFRPSYQQVKCPADIDVEVLPPHSCGYLTVLQYRSDPDGLRAKIFVVKVSPTGARPEPDPVLSLSGDVGFGQGFGGASLGAQRTNRIFYLMDPRGTGHSRPDLACPGVTVLAPPAGPASTGAGTVGRFLRAVRACRNRLTSQGIDLADYDLSAVAGDAEDLRRALGIRSWNLASYGTYSGALLETLALHPGGIRAAWLDSPSFPQTDPFTEAITGTERALGQVFAACKQDRRCATAFPGLAQQWQQALNELARHPIAAKAPGSGPAVPVSAATLVLAVRSILSQEGTTSLAALPATIAAAAAGHISPQLRDIVTAPDGAFQLGYQPDVHSAGTFSLGAYLSIACADQAPFASKAALSAAANHPGFGVFTANPYLAACRIWHVPAAPAQLHQPVRTSVPMLIMTGQFDAFSPLPDARAAAASLHRAWVIQIPWQAHNVLGGSQCAINIRNAWINAPNRPPATGCLHHVQPVPFDTSPAG
jgi:pimeloyl-ACP methyl ester carboxylesterase